MEGDTKRQMKKAVIKVVSLVFLLSAVLVGVSLYMDEGYIKDTVADFVFSKNVEKYRPIVQAEAKEQGIEEQVNVLLAMMMQESGGRGDDPMQASESLCGEVGCIDDPEQSIAQGVAYFAKALERAEGDVKLAVQSYNFGHGFIDFVKKEASEYSEALAIEFSQEMYANAADPSMYSCLRKEAKQYDACYGDIYYVRDVMSFENKFAVK